MTVQAIVDTGAWTLVINNETCDKLGLRDKGFGEATLADGQERELVGVHGDIVIHRV